MNQLPANMISDPPARSLGAALDQGLHVWQSHFTGGGSPNTLSVAFLDWVTHAMNAPFQTAEQAATAQEQWARFWGSALGEPGSIAAKPGDNRFADPAWQQFPFALMVQSVLLGEEWWSNLVQSPKGVERSNGQIVAFTLRQWLDLFSPSNIPWLNPEIIAATRDRGGENLRVGFANFLRDQAASHGGAAPSSFTIGKDLAATPGKVVFRNELIELLQYCPTTGQVGAEPVLFVPAWIMKYYILDLSPGNSLVRWLVAQGRTVFMISWRNPTAAMADLALDDYRTQGVMAALDAISAICGKARIHATGYCLGGTLLSITAAAMARDGDLRLASLSLFAAQTDFTEAGELQLFITADQLDFLNDIMQQQGFLDSSQMGSAFQMLRSNDLIWSHAIRDYWLGEQAAPFDLMAWNDDGTRLPARMHIEYLRELFLDNDLAEGRYQVGGLPLELGDVALPVFAVGTERDHIAPWHSVFKIHLQNHHEVTFVLTSGGHNAGIVSEPGHSHRHFRLRVREAGGRTLGPEEWQHDTKPQEGSWWPQWSAWLDRHASGPLGAAPPLGLGGQADFGAAPGRYILEK